MSKTLKAKTWALLITAGVLSTGTTFAAPTDAEPQAPQATQNVGTCTGTVVDEDGEPLTGATVRVEGTSLAAAADLDGNFAISNVKVGSKLIVSYVGYEPATVTWEGTPVTITMTSNENLLDEIVVVGFGTQKRANLTGAVSTVTSKELVNRPVSSVADALQGLAPGLTVTAPSTGGNLSATRSMTIRGATQLGNSAVTPLIIIDGVEGSLETVNPQDVENISILKDAAASSIYGSRAAGGVIIVTTKKGSEGKLTVNYSDSFRWSHSIRMPKSMDSYNFAIVMNEGAINNGSGQWLPDSKVQQIKENMDGTWTGPTMFENTLNGHWEVWDYVNIIPIANTDWLDEHFGKTPFSQEHNLSITGGNEKVNYYFSASVLDQEGVLRYGDDNMQRYYVNGRVNLQLTKWLTFSYATKWWRENYDAPSLVGVGAVNQFYHDVMRYWPLIPTVDPNGHYVRESYIPALLDGGRYKRTKNQVDQQFNFMFTPTEGLILNAEFAYRNTSNYIHRAYFNTYSYSVDDVPYKDNAAAMPSNSSVYDYSYRSNYFNPNVYGTYSFNINDKHDFKVMAGFQAEKLSYQAFDAQQTDVINNIPWLDTTSGTPSVSGGSYAWSTAGWFGRINYDYMGRYLVEANVRYDGSSRFRKGSRWTWSPSFSLGWNIANENFMESIAHKVNNLKLRFSWGVLSNQSTDAWYPTYANMGYNANSSGWLVNNQHQSLASAAGLVSSSLTWEKNRTWDIGFDWGLFNNRFTGSFDYYNRHSYDIVGPGPDLPSILGATVPNVNSVSYTSKGWEVTVGWRDRIGKDFSYGISFNISDYKAIITDYANNPTKSLSIGQPNGKNGPYYEGATLGNIWGYKTIGIAKTQDEMDAHLAKVSQSSIAAAGWSAGDIMYADLDGDGRISTGSNTADDSGDLMIIGNTTPRFQYGASIDLQWKGFDLRIYMQGVGKRDYWATDAVFTGPFANNQWQAVALTEHLDYFRPEGTTNPLGPNLDSYYPRPNWGGGRNFQKQTRYLQDASYWRLKNVTLGYTFPQSLTRKAYIENLRIYLSGENLATITNFTGTGDPELIDAYFSAYGYGKVYPLSRVFSVGLNVTF